MSLLSIGKDPLVSIFSHFPTEDLLTCKMVCREFRRIITNDLLPARLQNTKHWCLIETQADIIPCIEKFIMKARRGEKSVIQFQSNNTIWLEASLLCGGEKSVKILSVFARNNCGIQAQPLPEPYFQHSGKLVGSNYKAHHIQSFFPSEVIDTKTIKTILENHIFQDRKHSCCFNLVQRFVSWFWDEHQLLTFNTNPAD